VPDEQTCGKGPERNSVAPIAMAEVSARPAGKAMTSPDTLGASGA
jgi:hypothetical protein